MNFKDELTCNHCNEIFKSPIMLNCCGKNICKHHIDDLLANKTSHTFSCPFCNQENSNQNFHINELLEKLIGREFHELKLDSKNELVLNNLKMEIGNLEAILKDPENVINEQIRELKREADLDREIIILHIDELADNINQQLDTYEKKFKSEYKSNIDLKHYNDLVESSRKQLAEYEKCLSLFSTKKEERDEKTNQSEQVIDMLQSKITEAKNNLFSNLSIRYKADEDYLFGELKITVSLFKFIILKVKNLLKGYQLSLGMYNFGTDKKILLLTK